MKIKITLQIFLLILFMFSPSWSETMTMDDLVERNDLYYKRFSFVPYTGGISGYRVEGGEELSEKGSFRKGKKNGEWLTFHENGELHSKGKFKDGKITGLWEWYLENGQISFKGNFKDGKEEGVWEYYHENGQISMKGNFKDGKEEGVWEYYRYNGRLYSCLLYTSDAADE